MAALNIYNLDLERIATIESFVSLYWAEGYNTLGSISLELQAHPAWRKLIRPDVYVGRSDRRTLMLIKSVAIKGTTITATGFPATRLFEDRYFGGMIKDANAEAALLGMIDQISPWPHVQAAEPSGLAAGFASQVSRKNAYEVCETVAQACDMGFELRHDRRNKRLLMTCYQPEDDGRLKFAPGYGNMGEQEIALSTQQLKNVAVVLGQGHADNRVEVIVGALDLTGADRREMVVDARNEQQEDDETDDDYRARLAAVGDKKLKEQLRTENLSFIIAGSEFGRQFDLGDWLTCSLPDFGVQITARVSFFAEKIQLNKSQTTVRIGTPIIIRR